MIPRMKDRISLSFIYMIDKVAKRSSYANDFRKIHP